MSYYPSAYSDPYYSTHTSTTFVSGRRGSSASVLSERRPYQSDRRCSDVSVASDKSSDNINNNNSTKRVQFCTPIHEHNEEALEYKAIDHSTNPVTKKELNISEIPSILLEEPKSPQLLYYQTTEI